MKSLNLPVVLLAMVFPFALTAVYFVLLADSPEMLQKTAFGIGKTVQFLLPVVWVALVLREPWFVRPWNSRGLFSGVVFGAIVFVAMLSLYVFWLSLPGEVLGNGSRAHEAILAKVDGIGLNNPLLFLLLGLFYSVIHSGLEEYYWRWFVFGQLRQIFGKESRPTGGESSEPKATAPPGTGAGLLSSFGFMAHHVLLLGTYFGYDSPFCWLGSLGVAVGGMFWCWLYHRSDSIWGPWLSHGIVDAAIFIIGYFVIWGL